MTAICGFVLTGVSLKKPAASTPCEHAGRVRLTGPLHEPAERLGQFTAAYEIDRLAHPDERVASNLAALFHAGLFHLALCFALYSGMGEVLRITQQELGYLVG